MKSKIYWYISEHFLDIRESRIEELYHQRKCNRKQVKRLLIIAMAGWGY